jgi:outer membrane usher protein FimD/PapC
LPFITRMSKFYDLTLFDNSISSNIKSSSTSYTHRDNNSSDNQFGYKNAIEDNSHLNDTINSSNNYNDYDDELMKFMQSQIPKQKSLDDKIQAEEITDEDMDNLITPEHLETIKKLRELQD